MTASPMVCFDLSAAAHERAGLGRYAAGLAQALVDLGVPLNAFINDPRESRLRPPLSDLPTFTANLPRKQWRLRTAASYFGGPSMDRAFNGVSLFHATEHLLPWLTRARSVFTLHDVAYQRYPHYHLLQNRLYLSLMMPRFLARADAIICVSEHTRRDALHYYPKLNPAKIHVIPEGVEPHFRPPALPADLAPIRAKYGLPERFILYVGTIEPRKNLPVLLEAYAALRQHMPEVGLVIVGGKGWLYESFFQTLKRLALEPHVILTGYVPEADLPLLMACARVFAYPSEFEGFGLPPLEAMACGVPVACSNASSLPEVVGEAGLLLSPHDAHGWQAALYNLLTDDDLRADLRERSLARARQFTWQKAAQQTLEVYRSLLPAETV
jgi:glycosyltransferase involved in cell wall biosynthesis